MLSTCILTEHNVQPRKLNIVFMFFVSYIFSGFFLCILSTSAAPQRPANGTVPSQVAIHHRIDRVLPGAGEELDLNPGLLICNQVRYH
jgi:hypothetical protein